MIFTSRKVKIRSKNVSFSSRILKSGETAYYRGGRRVTSSYQIRLAKGILAGKTVAEARGHPFGAYSDRLLTREQLQREEEFHLERWAERPTRKGRGETLATYYMKVIVTSESSRQAGSPDGTEEACVARTLQLRDPATNDQRGFTYKDLARRFETIALFTLQKYQLRLCSLKDGEDPKAALRRDVIAIWRHSRK